MQGYFMIQKKFLGSRYDTQRFKFDRRSPTKARTENEEKRWASIAYNGSGKMTGDHIYVIYGFFDLQFSSPFCI